MPDGRGGYGSDKRTAVMRAVSKAYESESNRSACNFFVIAVVKAATGQDLLSGQANDIYDQIKKSPWVLLGKGDTGAKIAGLTAAHDGKLVVAAWKDAAGGNGHCAIVLDFTTSKKPPSPDDEKGIRDLMKDRAVIAAGRLNQPENAGTYGKISDPGNGFGAAKLANTIFASIAVG